MLSGRAIARQVLAAALARQPRHLAFVGDCCHAKVLTQLLQREAERAPLLPRPTLTVEAVHSCAAALEVRYHSAGHRRACSEALHGHSVTV